MSLAQYGKAPVFIVSLIPKFLFFLFALTETSVVIKNDKLYSNSHFFLAFLTLNMHN